MTGKKVIAILAAGALLCGLAGCDKKDTGSSAPNNVQSVPQSVPENKSEAAQSTGTSSDNSVSSAPQRTVEIKPEITMDGKLISLPCKVKDIKGITLDTEVSFIGVPATADGVEYSQVTFYLNDARGTIRLAGDCSEKTDLGEETVIGIELREGIPFSYSDVTSDSTMDDVLSVLGEPDRSSDQNKSYFLRYYIDGDPSNYVDFGFNETHDKILVVRVYLLGKGEGSAEVRETAVDVLLRDYPSIKDDLDFDETKAGAVRVMDIDFDGKDETVIQVGPTFGIAVYENTENGWDEAGRFANDVQMSYIPSLDKLYPYENGSDKYWYYAFHFDNGGVMTADVIGAVKHEGNEYTVEYLLSHGVLNYSDIAEPFSENFYRVGWNKGDIDFTQDHGDIGEDDFRALWDRYPEAPEL